MEETSLSDFVNSEASATGGEEDAESPAEVNGQEGEGRVSATTGGESSEITPEPPTSEWHPDGITCVDCGSSVTRVWFHDGRRVCPECKEWE